MTRPFTTRRSFLKTGLATSQAFALGSLIPPSALVRLGKFAESAPPITDPRLRELVSQGLDAAKGAGATYADVRLTHTTWRNVAPDGSGDHEALHAGVRALVRGYWGFASGPVWSAAELERLGKEASWQATTNAEGLPRAVELAPVPAISNGHWEMPVDSEPFSVHPLEIRDYLGGLVASIKRYAPLGHGEAIRPTVECRFRTQDQAFGSTVGTYYTQRLHRIEGRLEVEVERRRPGDSWQDKRAVDLLTPAGAGWEYFRDQPLCDAALALVDEIHADATLPIKPVDVNRYDVVLDAFGVSKILSGTVGCATELDRILGYEANKGGTSYLREPFDMLDSFAIGTSLLTVTANRSEAGGAATVKWDDEGVQPRNVTLVEKGIVRDLQTTRESAGWLSAGLSGKPAARNHVFQSHGCAASDTAGYGVICLTANLKMVPSTEQRRFDDLIAGLPKGVAIKSLWCDMDFQQASGHGMGRAYEIKDGKISARLSGAGVLFRTVELWKSLKTIGGPQSARRFGHGVGKGEPMQLGYHSVTAVPATFSNVSVIDIYRRG